MIATHIGSLRTNWNNPLPTRIAFADAEDLKILARLDRIFYDSEQKKEPTWELIGEVDGNGFYHEQMTIAARRFFCIADYSLSTTIWQTAS